MRLFNTTINFLKIFFLSAAAFFTITNAALPAEAPAAKDKGKEFTYTIHNSREPFMPLVSPEGYVINLEPQTEVSDIHLEGIIFDPGGKSFAVINGNVISENETVGNFRLKEIKKDKIILQNGQNSHIIELIKEEAGEKKR